MKDNLLYYIAWIGCREDGQGKKKEKNTYEKKRF